VKKGIKYGLLLFATIIIIGFILKGDNTNVQFDSEKWKNWKETKTTLSLRWDMMKSLRNTHKLKKKTKTEIIELLGEPESKTKKEFRYYLGFSKSGINTGSLTIKFDKNNIVTDFMVWQG